jgi:salicylate hydroxylase
MYKDIEEKLAAQKGMEYTDSYICGLPRGMELPNGVVIGAEQETARL